MRPLGAATRSFGGEMRRQRMLRRQLRRAEELIRSEKYGEAATILEGMVSRERRYDWSSKRTELQTLLQLAKLYYAQGQNPSAVPRGRDWYGEALSTMDTWFANKANPDPDSHYFMAQIHYKLGDFDAGNARLETAFRIAGERGIAVEESWRELLQLMGDSDDR